MSEEDRSVFSFLVALNADEHKSFLKSLLIDNEANFYGSVTTL